MRRQFTCASAVLAIVMTAGVAGAREGRAAAKTSAPATVTGCLHADGARFVMTDVAGASKGRSWKTAYLTRRGGDVQLVGAPASLKLRDHVGQKVTLAGTRGDDGHFTPQSIRQTWQVSSCS